MSSFRLLTVWKVCCSFYLIFAVFLHDILVFIDIDQAVSTWILKDAHRIIIYVNDGLNWGQNVHDLYPRNRLIKSLPNWISNWKGFFSYENSYCPGLFFYLHFRESVLIFIINFSFYTWKCFSSFKNYCKCNIFRVTNLWPIYLACLQRPFCFSSCFLLSTLSE